MWPNPQKTVDLVAFTEEILNGKLHFLCSAQKYFCGVALYYNRYTEYRSSYDMSGDNEKSGKKPPLRVEVVVKKIKTFPKWFTSWKNFFLKTLEKLVTVIRM